MVLVQLYITQANNGTYFAVPITGKACVRVLGVQYSETGNTVDRVIQIQSDNLYFTYSPQRYLTFMSMHGTASQANLSLDMSRDAFHLTDQQFNGQLYIKVVQQYSSDASALPNPFNVLLNLDFEFIDQQYK